MSMPEVTATGTLKANTRPGEARADRDRDSGSGSDNDSPEQPRAKAPDWSAPDRRSIAMPAYAIAWRSADETDIPTADQMLAAQFSANGLPAHGGTALNATSKFLDRTGKGGAPAGATDNNVKYFTENMLNMGEAISSAPHLEDVHMEDVLEAAKGLFSAAVMIGRDAPTAQKTRIFVAAQRLSATCGAIKDDTMDDDSASQLASAITDLAAETARAVEARALAATALAGDPLSASFTSLHGAASTIARAARALAECAWYERNGNQLFGARTPRCAAAFAVLSALSTSMRSLISARTTPQGLARAAEGMSPEVQDLGALVKALVSKADAEAATALADQATTDHTAAAAACRSYNAMPDSASTRASCARAIESLSQTMSTVAGTVARLAVAGDAAFVGAAAVSLLEADVGILESPPALLKSVSSSLWCRPGRQLTLEPRWGERERSSDDLRSPAGTPQVKRANGSTPATSTPDIASIADSAARSEGTSKSATPPTATAAAATTSSNPSPAIDAGKTATDALAAAYTELNELSTEMANKGKGLRKDGAEVTPSHEMGKIIKSSSRAVFAVARTQGKAESVGEPAAQLNEKIAKLVQAGLRLVDWVTKPDNQTKLTGACDALEGAMQVFIDQLATFTARDPKPAVISSHAAAVKGITGTLRALVDLLLLNVPEADKALADGTMPPLKIEGGDEDDEGAGAAKPASGPSLQVPGISAEAKAQRDAEIRRLAEQPEDEGGVLKKTFDHLTQLTKYFILEYKELRSHGAEPERIANQLSTVVKKCAIPLKEVAMSGGEPVKLLANLDSLANEFGKLEQVRPRLGALIAKQLDALLGAVAAFNTQARTYCKNPGEDAQQNALGERAEAMIAASQAFMSKVSEEAIKADAKAFGLDKSGDSAGSGLVKAESAVAANAASSAASGGANGLRGDASTPAVLGPNVSKDAFGGFDIIFREFFVFYKAVKTTEEKKNHPFLTQEDMERLSKAFKHCSRSGKTLSRAGEEAPADVVPNIFALKNENHKLVEAALYIAELSKTPTMRRAMEDHCTALNAANEWLAAAADLVYTKGSGEKPVAILLDLYKACAATQHCMYRVGSRAVSCLTQQADPVKEGAYDIKAAKEAKSFTAFVVQASAPAAFTAPVAGVRMGEVAIKITGSLGVLRRAGPSVDGPARSFSTQAGNLIANVRDELDKGARGGPNVLPAVVKALMECAQPLVEFTSQLVAETPKDTPGVNPAHLSSAGARVTQTKAVLESAAPDDSGVALAALEPFLNAVDVLAEAVSKAAYSVDCQKASNVSRDPAVLAAYVRLGETSKTYKAASEKAAKSGKDFGEHIAKMLEQMAAALEELALTKANPVSLFPALDTLAAETDGLSGTAGLVARAAEGSDAAAQKREQAEKACMAVAESFSEFSTTVETYVHTPTVAAVCDQHAKAAENFSAKLLVLADVMADQAVSLSAPQVAPEQTISFALGKLAEAGEFLMRTAKALNKKDKKSGGGRGSKTTCHRVAVGLHAIGKSARNAANPDAKPEEDKKEKGDEDEEGEGENLPLTDNAARLVKVARKLVEKCPADELVTRLTDDCNSLDEARTLYAQSLAAYTAQPNNADTVKQYAAAVVALAMYLKHTASDTVDLATAIDEKTIVTKVVKDEAGEGKGADGFGNTAVELENLGASIEDPKRKLPAALEDPYHGLSELVRDELDAKRKRPAAYETPLANLSGSIKEFLAAKGVAAKVADPAESVSNDLVALGKAIEKANNAEATAAFGKLEVSRNRFTLGVAAYADEPEDARNLKEHAASVTALTKDLDALLAKLSPAGAAGGDNQAGPAPNGTAAAPAQQQQRQGCCAKCVVM